MLTFRNATIDDARLLFLWRNDLTTRMGSHNSSEIVYDSHVSWLNATLTNPMRQLFIAEDEGKPVGTVRVDRETDKISELSWTVAPEARGKGIAKNMVQMVVNQVLKTCSVRAKVKKRNEASVKVAEAAGMKIYKEDGDMLHFCRWASIQESC